MLAACGERARLRWLLAAAIALTAWVVAPAPATAATRAYAAHYKGTLTYRTAFENPADGGSFHRITASVSFDAKVSTEYPSSGSPTTTGTVVAQGTYHEEHTNGTDPQTNRPRVDTIDCTFRQKARPDLTVVTAGPNAGASLGRLVGDMEVAGGTCLPTSVSTYLGLRACGSAGCVGVCEEDYAPGKQGDFARYSAATDPVVSGSRPKTLNVDVTLDPKGRCFGGTQSVVVSLQATFVTGGGKATTPSRRPPGGLTKEQREAKVIALEQIRDTWDKALTACSGTAAFATLFAAGPAGEAVGSVLVPAEAYQCAIYVDIIRDAADTFADPPLASDDVVARVAAAPPAPKLPACAAADAGARALCDAARSAALASIAADRRTARIAHAIDLTVSRESFAQLHRHTTAAGRQNRALRTLSAQLAQARRAGGAAGARLAGVLRGGGLGVGRDRAQATAQVATLAGRLGRKGLQRSKLRAIDASLLTPAAGDWLAALAKG
jgi:hypothetical protein